MVRVEAASTRPVAPREKKSLPSRKPYQIVSKVYVILVRYFENGPLEPGYPEMELYGKFHFHVVNFNVKVPRRLFFKNLEILEVIQGCALRPHGRLRRLTFNFGRLRKIPFARPGTLASSAVFS